MRFDYAFSEKGSAAASVRTVGPVDAHILDGTCVGALAVSGAGGDKLVDRVASRLPIRSGASRLP